MGGDYLGTSWSGLIGDFAVESFELIITNQMLNRIFRVILVKRVLHRNEFSLATPFNLKYP